MVISGDARRGFLAQDGGASNLKRRTRMSTPNPQAQAQPFSKSPAENYERYFVPAIGGPVAEDLIEAAKLQRGERVLDVACGTGVVARLAAERVGSSGTVAGLDVHPGMLAVARASTPPGTSINWYEASAEAMPLPDNSFDVVLCQMGLQFMSNKVTALREMGRVLDRGGRILINVPGPKPSLFGILTEALARHIAPQAAAFGDIVFSLHDTGELTGLLRDAGFREVNVQAKPKSLKLPASPEFLWQYIYSTPLVEPVSQAGAEQRAALEHEVCSQWQELENDGGLPMEVGITTATARK
jgi:ubiquinone/menaquinone biosynthesis C-methylase UbiE